MTVSFGDSLERGKGMTYARAGTIWHFRPEGPIVWISGSEGTGTRLVKYGETVWGTTKWNRLPMADAPAEAIALAVCTQGDRCIYHAHLSEERK